MAGFTLQGSRIFLQLLEKEHLRKRVEFLNDIEVQETLNFDYPTSLAKTEAWFSKNVLSGNRVDFTFIRNDDSAVIGFGGFINIHARAQKAELYIFIGDKSCWGKGYGRDGYKLLVNYGFAELGLERIHLYQLSERTGYQGYDGPRMENRRVVEKGYLVSWRVKRSVFALDTKGGVGTKRDLRRDLKKGN